MKTIVCSIVVIIFCFTASVILLITQKAQHKHTVVPINTHKPYIHHVAISGLCYQAYGDDEEEIVSSVGIIADRLQGKGHAGISSIVIQGIAGNPGGVEICVIPEETRHRKHVPKSNKHPLYI